MAAQNKYFTDVVLRVTISGTLASNLNNIFIPNKNIMNEELDYTFDIYHDDRSYLSDVKNIRSARYIEWSSSKTSTYNARKNIFNRGYEINVPRPKNFKNKKDKIKRYNEFINHVSEIKAPYPHLKIMIKTHSRTFNHVCDYILHEGIIWYRTRTDGHNLEWKELYFEGYPDRIPLEIYVDGENLFVLVKHEDQYYFHYKKVLVQKLLVFFDEAEKVRPSSGFKSLLRINNINSAEIIYSDDYQFVLHKNYIWTKSLKGENKKWLSLWYDGWPNDTILNLVVDDQNLIVNTENNTYHISKPQIEELLMEQQFPYKNRYHYSVITINEIDTWLDRWFTFPYFYLYKLNPKSEKRLKIPSEMNGPLENVLAPSNRGGFVQYFENILGGQHPPYTAVTGIYLSIYNPETLESGILLADPWLPRQFNKKSFPLISDKYITIPKGMIIHKLAASASFIVIYCIDQNGQDVLLSRFEDFDSIGINPGLKYSEVRQTTDNKKISREVRILPDDRQKMTAEQLWSVISMSTETQENISNKVDFYTLTVLQTGKGNYGRTIRIETKDKLSYYETKPNDTYWRFKSY